MSGRGYDEDVGRIDTMGEDGERKALKDRYELRRRIESGGFGTAWYAWDRMLDMPVAVKEYTETDPKRKVQFLREARSLARFSGEPGIVNVRDFLEDEQRVYLVMEYLDGMDLKAFIESEGPVTFEQALALMTPVMKTVEKLHKAGMIHRDISPENIRMLPDHTMKLLDFGSAMDMSVDDGKTMTVMVKPGYAPAEQYMGKSQQGTWTDVYALCATLYKCITGNTPMDSLQRSFHDDLPKPSQVGGAISAADEAVLMRGLAVKKEDRILTVEELMRLWTDTEGIESERWPDTKGEKSLEASVVKKSGLPRENKGITEKKAEPPRKIKSTADKQKKLPGETKAATEKEPSPLRITKAAAKKTETPRRLKSAVEKTPESPQEIKSSGRKKRKGSVKKTKIASAILGAAAAVIIIAIALGMYFQNPYRDGDSSYAYIKNETVTRGMIRKIARDKQVKNLNLFKCVVEDVVLEEIAKMKYIQGIDFNDCSGYTDLAPLGNMKTLTSLEYEQEDSLDGSSIFNGDFSGLKKLSLSSMELTGDMKFLENFTGLEQLSILGCEGITDIGFLSAMPSMKRLTLLDIVLPDGDWGALANCINLEYLNCDETNMSDVSWAASCKGLKELHASHCGLTDIGPLADCKELWYLGLNGNQIEDVSSLKALESMNNLYLSDNKITDIGALGGMTGLTYLTLNNNQITDITPLKSCTDLSALELKNNRISDISALENCSNLMTLYLDKNQVSDISPLAGCKTMQFMGISGNQIANLDACELMIKLTALDASDNQITDISKLVGCSGLKRLALENNQITDIAALGNQFTSLTDLNISNNQVTSLKPLETCNKLAVFIGEQNGIASLDGMGGKPSLKVVLTNNNQISDIRAISSSLNQLTYIDFANNRITDISPLSGMASGNKVLLLENNKIKDISSLPTGNRYQALTLYGNPISDFSVIGKFDKINGTHDILYISYVEDMDGNILSGSKYADQIHIVDVPVERQAALQKNIKAQKNIGTSDVKFQTLEEADAEMKDYRSELMTTVTGSGDDEKDGEGDDR